MRSQFWMFVFHLRNRLTGALPRIMVGVIAAVAIAAALGGAVWMTAAVATGFSEAANSTRSSRDEHPVRRAGELAEQLFNNAVTRGWLAFDTAASKLELQVDCDALAQGFPIYDRRGAASPTSADHDDGDQQLTARQICRSDPGAAIRAEITAWNRSANVVAVRDDRNLNAACKNGVPTEDYVPDDCYESEWQASFAPSRSDAAVTAASAATILPGSPADAIRSILRNGAIGFTPWRRFDVATPSSTTLVLHSTVNPNGSRGHRRVVVDVIGDLDPLDAPVVVAKGSNRPEPPVSIEYVCDRARTSAGCQRAAQRRGGNRMPRGARLTFEFDAARAVDIRIALSPIIAVPRRVAALEKARFVAPDYARDYDDEAIVKLTDRVQVRCRHVDPNTIVEGDDDDVTMTPAEGTAPAREFDLCGLYWVTPSPPPAPVVPAGAGAIASTRPAVPSVASFADPGSLSVRLGGPEPVVLTKVVSVPDPNGIRKAIDRVMSDDAARQLGLVPVVGVDDKDEQSLLGQLRRRVPTGGRRDVELTIDARLQRAAFDVLKGLMGRAAPFAEINRDLPAQYDKDRRGAMVLIDAGAAGPGGSGFDQDTGRILAAASWPQLDPRMSEADIQTYMQVRPWESPLAARGWSGNDRYNAPGSSLKPIVTLAAIDRAARGADAIADFLGAERSHPGLAPAALQAFGGPAAAPLQFSYTSRALVVPVGNSSRTVEITTEGGNICHDMAPRQGCQPNATTPVTLRRMMAHSNNIWFARLALALDSDAVMTAGPNGRKREINDTAAPTSRPLAIAAMVARLWPREARDILVGDQVALYSRVRATAVQLDEMNATRPRRQSVALNGIGQAAQATPLAMASMFASIATGQVVLPRLTVGNDPRPMRGAPLFDPASHDGAALDRVRAEEMLSNLRAALSDVVHVGTAAGRFGPLAERVWGKTGTAQVGQRADDPNTVWFVGWIEGLKLGGFERRRVAFACMITHANKEQAAGGRVCAPLMRILLQRVEAQQQSPQAAQPAPPHQPPARAERARR